MEASAYDEAPRFLIRDRDAIYAVGFQQRVKHASIDEVVTACRSPWQSPYVERPIGSFRRECLDHATVFSEPHLIRVLDSYFAYPQLEAVFVWETADGAHFQNVVAPRVDVIVCGSTLRTACGPWRMSGGSPSIPAGSPAVGRAT